MINLILKQPSIVTLVHHEVRDLSLEVEFVGPDLAQFVDEKRISVLPEDTALQVWMDVSAGLAHIHARRVLHLDIKPENILLSDDGRAKICDFGISYKEAVMPIAFETAVQDAVKPIPFDGGTPRYTPPEFVRFGRRGCPSDVWAFGLVMMFVLRIIPLPKQGGWRIAHIRSKAIAAAKMLEWFEEVEQAKTSIPGKYALLRRMLTADSNQRITSSDLAASSELIQMQNTSPRGRIQDKKLLACVSK